MLLEGLEAVQTPNHQALLGIVTSCTFNVYHITKKCDAICLLILPNVPEEPQ